MALIVETGAGIAGADSYASVAQYKAFCDAFGYSYASVTDPEIEVGLRRGALVLDYCYGQLYPGWRYRDQTQGLQWPRSGVTRPQYPYASISQESVPVEIINAACEIARREIASPGSILPDVNIGRTPSRIAIEDGVSIDYAVESIGLITPDKLRPTLFFVDALLSSLFRVNRTSPLVGSSYR